MVFKRKKRGLGLYQSKAKWRRRALKSKKESTDDISTIAYSINESKSSSDKYDMDDISTMGYSDHVKSKSKEEELNEILDKISDISNKMIDELNEDMSDDEYVMLMHSDKRNNKEVHDDSVDQLEMQWVQLINHIKQFLPEEKQLADREDTQVKNNEKGQIQENSSECDDIVWNICNLQLT